MFQALPCNHVSIHLSGYVPEGEGGSRYGTTKMVSCFGKGQLTQEGKLGAMQYKGTYLPTQVTSFLFHTFQDSQIGKLRRYNTIPT